MVQGIRDRHHCVHSTPRAVPANGCPLFPIQSSLRNVRFDGFIDGFEGGKSQPPIEADRRMVVGRHFQRHPADARAAKAAAVRGARGSRPGRGGGVRGRRQGSGSPRCRTGRALPGQCRSIADAPSPSGSHTASQVAAGRKPGLPAMSAISRRQPAKSPRQGKTRVSISLRNPRYFARAKRVQQRPVPGQEAIAPGGRRRVQNPPGEVDLHAKTFEIGDVHSYSNLAVRGRRVNRRVSQPKTQVRFLQRRGISGSKCRYRLDSSSRMRQTKRRARGCHP